MKKEKKDSRSLREKLEQDFDVPSDILCGLLVGAVIGVVCYIGYLKLYYKVSPHITYISDQYTPTGYDHDDIDKILCILAFTLVYAFLRAIVMAGGV